ncbi:unnamed protein product [Anisakis simplex]|uniref:Uncharacterized protein n=1 Tax=Anisakis simplex TaxID=6269 RepID=A0A0M3J6D3_ANISI|nr:unnamed protein product [Anisakis simplex]
MNGDEMVDAQRRLMSSSTSSNDEIISNRSEGSPLDQKPTLWQVNGQPMMSQLSPTTADQANLVEPAQGSSSASDLSADAEGVWSPDIDQVIIIIYYIYYYI